MSHFIEICEEHGSVLRQCRCPARYKMTIRKTCPGGGVCPGFDALGEEEIVEKPVREIEIKKVDVQPDLDMTGDWPGPTTAQDMAIEGIEQRKAIGLERYGTLLYPFNSRDMFRDLLEECQDAIVYAHGYLAEREAMADRMAAAKQKILELIELCRNVGADGVQKELAGVLDIVSRTTTWLEGKDTNATNAE